MSLGIQLDNTLSWRPQVLQVTKKVNRVLYFLKTIRPCTSISLRRRLVESLVVPHLDYCKVLYSDVCNELRLQLQRLANNGIRYIHGIRRHEHIPPYRRKLGWMTSLTRTDYFASLVMYRIVRLKEPPILLSVFKSYKPYRPVRGPRKDLEPIKVTTDWDLNSFQVKYSKFWNNIPPCIRDLPSFSRFKKVIRQYLYKSDLQQ